MKSKVIVSKQEILRETINRLTYGYTGITYITFRSLNLKCLLLKTNQKILPYKRNVKRTCQK